MKVAAFLGSPRKNGNTARLLKEFLKGVSEKNGIIINQVFLQEKKILDKFNEEIEEKRIILEKKKEYRVGMVDWLGRLEAEGKLDEYLKHF